MKKFITLSIAFMLTAMAAASAQTASEGRFSLAVYAGSGILISPSNLSAYGVNHRQEYKHGLSADIRAYYDFKDFGLVGLKCNEFIASANYLSDGATAVAEDVFLFYLAPQLGDRRRLTDRLSLEYVFGIGYMYYQSESLAGSTERERTKGFLAANTDLSGYYRLKDTLSLGLSFSFVGGRTSSLKEKANGKKQNIELSDWNRIKVNRIDISVSLHAIF
ncbi:MAG: hypothetical protein Q4D56_04495 [Bacteroides sp.]|nr:hypothetical protein [Bacteroides sp.]